MLTIDFDPQGRKYELMLGIDSKLLQGRVCEREKAFAGIVLLPLPAQSEPLDAIK